jgi:hypothetical protein
MPDEKAAEIETAEMWLAAERAADAEADRLMAQADALTQQAMFALLRSANARRARKRLGIGGDIKQQRNAIAGHCSDHKNFGVSKVD